ncbi:hypothetical protein BDV40DRAFT_306037 [Aspergillus tamarii]|uniref:ferric-chelate reductase (NADPH) n=1 Tax=Aspergillus tamarii TaxID=41984 RepID=A0A5N6UD65_ASPTM|nr:hypothetical protein BDV40DRAFT_306037 [Aspergillus tamarii]
MDALMVYTYIAAGCAAMLLLQGYMARCFSFLFNPQLIFLLHKGLTLPYLFRRRRFWGPVTRLQAILHLLYFGGTLVFNILGVSGLAAASSRAALLAVLHLIPTLCVPQFSLAAKLCGISLSTYGRIHRTFGIMATLQSILHVVLSLREVAFSLADRIQRYGFMAAIALAVMLAATVIRFHHWSYELSSKAHSTLGVFVAVAAWLHLKRRFGYGGVCLITAVGSFLLSSIVHLFLQLFRNTMTGKSLAVADVKKVKDAIELTFEPPRPWKVRSGQYVYIRAPAVRLLSFAESHPFSIVWWKNGPDEKAVSVSVLAKVESGFTKALNDSSHKRLRVLLDGPYGRHKDTEPYDSIVLVATGAGIAAQLPYARELVQHQLDAQKDKSGYTHKRKQRVSLIWQLDEEYHEDWVCDWMDQLLEEDSKSLALHYSLYILHKSNSACQEGENIHYGRRGAAFYGKPDFHRILEKELQLCYGKLLLSVAADSETRDKLRRIIITSGAPIDLYEPDYQPHRRRGGFWAPKRKVQHIGAV